MGTPPKCVKACVVSACVAPGVACAGHVSPRKPLLPGLSACEHADTTSHPARRRVPTPVATIPSLPPLVSVGNMCNSGVRGSPCVMYIGGFIVYPLPAWCLHITFLKRLKSYHNPNSLPLRNAEGVPRVEVQPRAHCMPIRAQVVVYSLGAPLRTGG